MTALAKTCIVHTTTDTGSIANSHTQELSMDSIIIGLGEPVCNFPGPSEKAKSRVHNNLYGAIQIIL